MADVFISYQRADRPKARQLAELLEGFGFSVWWDADLLPGETYGSAIAEIIRTSRAALVIWSPEAVKSNWVLDEAARARDEGKLIPLSLGEAQLPMGFGAIHTHNFSGWNGEHDTDNIEPVLKSVERLVGRQRSEFSKPQFAANQSKRAPNVPVDRLQAAAFNRWISDFLWPLLYVAGLFLLISTVAFLLPGSTDYYQLSRELIKLVHIYTGMIILGGGVFLFLLFRIAARAATRQERWACAEAAKKLVLFVWAPAIVLQPLIGIGMVYVKHTFYLEFTAAYFPRWLQLSFVLYVAASLSWITGFRAAWETARTDADYGGVQALAAMQFKRDVLLGVALACTIIVYGLMVYRDEFQRHFAQ